MSFLVQVYHHLPLRVRAAAATLRGYQLRTWRYGPETERLIEQAFEREQWNPEQWRSWQEHQLGSLLARAATRVPFYARLWSKRRQAGDRRSWEVLENWPILTKEALREDPRAFVADDCRPEHMFALNTSGTSGKPLRLWRTRAVNRAWYALVEARMRRWHGVSMSELWAIFGGQLVVPFARRRPPFWAYNGALRQLYCSTHHITADNVEHYAEALRRYKITHIIMYPSSVNVLASLATEQGVALPQLKVAISNAEILTPAQRTRIGEAFGCPVVNTYGMAEISAAASECPHGTMHIWPEVGILETLADDSDAPAVSDSGRFILTGLLNPDMPLIRYEVGDRGRLGPEGQECACGRPMPGIAALEGRSNDMVVTPDGRHVFWLNPVFYGIPVREAQIVQESADTLRVRFVPARQFGRKDAIAIERNLRDRVGQMHIVLEEVASLPRTTSGKLQAVVNTWIRRVPPSS